jgi:hypothetical protein
MIDLSLRKSVRVVDPPAHTARAAATSGESDQSARGSASVAAHTNPPLSASGKAGMRAVDEDAETIYSGG